MTHSLYWHLATISDGAPAAGFPPPRFHQPIAIATLRIRNRRAEIQAKVSGVPDKLLPWFDNELETESHVATLFGENFGWPVLLSTALTHGIPVPEIFRMAGVSTDLTTILGSRFFREDYSFAELLNAASLPPRAQLDVAAMWDPENKEDRAVRMKRIAQRLMVDCALIAMLDLRMDLAAGELEEDEYEERHQNIIEATMAKAPVLRRLLEKKENER